MTIFVQSCSTLGGGAHPRFQAIEPEFLSKDNLPWSRGQCDLDTECCYLPTEVVPIHLLAFACFRTARLAGAGISDGSSLHHVDSILRLLGLLTLQHRLLRFSPQRHHVPSAPPRPLSTTTSPQRTPEPLTNVVAEIGPQCS